jgi:hypothetical protein
MSPHFLARSLSLAAYEVKKVYRKNVVFDKFAEKELFLNQ